MVDEFQYIDKQRGKASTLFVKMYSSMSHFLCRFWGTKVRLNILTLRVIGSPLKTKRNRENYKRSSMSKTGYTFVVPVRMTLKVRPGPGRLGGFGFE